MMFPGLNFGAGASSSSGAMVQGGASLPAAPVVTKRRDQSAGRPSPMEKFAAAGACGGGSGAGGGGGGGGGRGRPKEEVLARVSKVAAEFEKADRDHARFFGVERKTQHKALVRLSDDVTKEMNRSSDEGRSCELSLAKKQVDSVLSLCRAFAKQTGFAQAFKDAQHFARMEPALEVLPCPIWMLQENYRLDVSTAKLVEFWPMLEPSFMKQSKIEDAEVEQMQEELVADRLLELSRSESSSSLAAKLRTMCAPAALPDGIAALVRSALVHVDVVARYESDSVKAEELEEAVRVMKRTEDKIANAICAYPSGRAVLEAAEARAIHLRQLANLAVGVMGTLNNLCSRLDEQRTADVVKWEDVATFIKDGESKLLAAGFLEKEGLVQQAPMVTQTPFGYPRRPFFPIRTLTCSVASLTSPTVASVW